MIREETLIMQRVSRRFKTSFDTDFQVVSDRSQKRADTIRLIEADLDAPDTDG